MELKNGYWVDANNNKWDVSFYSKEEALRYSKSLTNCRNCSDCSYCRDCRDCSYCNSCVGCRSCSYCRDCSSCRYCLSCGCCSSCTGCGYCLTCKDCRKCNWCTDCANCTDCSHCKSFCKNPERIVGSVMGSRNDHPSVYWLEAGKEQCVVGCFRGTLDELERAVEKTHKNNETYLNEYKNFIAKVRAYQGVMK